MKTAVLNVRGMTCQNCVRHVTESLQQVPGVQEVEVDLQSHTARVQVDETLTRNMDLVAAVRKAGYEVDGLQSGV